MCRHENTVSYFGTVRVASDGSLWILMDYMALGSIRDMIDLRKSPLTEPEIAYVTAYTLRGLNYLHSRGIIHRDIKAANILLNDRAEIKLADFGVSDYFANISGEYAVGTPLWMSPEVLKKRPATQGSDMWSLGITVIEMGDGMPPMHNISILKAMRKIKEGPESPTFSEPSKWTPPVLDLVAQCLQRDPGKRPSAYQLGSHKFLQNVTENRQLRQQMFMTLLLIHKKEDDEDEERAIVGQGPTGVPSVAPPASVANSVPQPVVSSSINVSEKGTSLAPTAGTTNLASSHPGPDDTPSVTKLKKSASSTQLPNLSQSDLSDDLDKPTGAELRLQKRNSAKKKKDKKAIVDNRDSIKELKRAHTDSHMIRFMKSINKKKGEIVKPSFPPFGSTQSQNNQFETKNSRQSSTASSSAIEKTERRKSLTLSLSRHLEVKKKPPSVPEPSARIPPSSPTSPSQHRFSLKVNNPDATSNPTNSSSTPASPSGPPPPPASSHASRTRARRVSAPSSGPRTSNRPLSVYIDTSSNTDMDSKQKMLSSEQDQVPSRVTWREQQKAPNPAAGTPYKINSSKQKEPKDPIVGESEGDSVGNELKKKKKTTKDPSPPASVGVSGTSASTPATTPPKPSKNIEESSESKKEDSSSGGGVSQFVTARPKKRSRSDSELLTVVSNFNRNRGHTPDKSPLHPDNADQSESTPSKPTANTPNPESNHKKKGSNGTSFIGANRTSAAAASNPNSAANSSNPAAAKPKKTKPEKDGSESEMDDQPQNNTGTSVLNPSDSDDDEDETSTFGTAITRETIKLMLQSSDEDGSLSLSPRSRAEGGFTEGNTGSVSTSQKDSKDKQSTVSEEVPLAEASIIIFGVYSNVQTGVPQPHLGPTAFRFPSTKVPNTKKTGSVADDISAGAFHIVAASGGGLICIGDDTSGQLGLGTQKKNLPTTVNPFFNQKDLVVVKVACGLNHSLVATENGKLYGFGRNSCGELGILNYFNQPKPLPIPFFDNKKIGALAAGGSHSLVALENGSLYCFGSNRHGQLGLGQSDSSINEIVASPVQISLLSDKKIVSVASKSYFSLVMTDEGQLYAFGENSNGQLGLGHRRTQFRPQLVAALSHKKIVHASCGMFHAAALTAEGHLYCWGTNKMGQLGLGTTDDYYTPQLVTFFANKKVLYVSCGFSHTMVLTGDGQVFAFGASDHGQLCLGNTHMQPTPQLVPAPFEDEEGKKPRKIKTIACGLHNTIFVYQDKESPSAVSQSLGSSSTSVPPAGSQEVQEEKKAPVPQPEKLAPQPETNQNQSQVQVKLRVAGAGAAATGLGGIRWVEKKIQPPSAVPTGTSQPVLPSIVPAHPTLPSHPSLPSHPITQPSDEKTPTKTVESKQQQVTKLKNLPASASVQNSEPIEPSTRNKKRSHNKEGSGNSVHWRGTTVFNDIMASSDAEDEDDDFKGNNSSADDDDYDEDEDDEGFSRAVPLVGATPPKGIARKKITLPSNTTSSPPASSGTMVLHMQSDSEEESDAQGVSPSPSNLLRGKPAKKSDPATKEIGSARKNSGSGSARGTTGGAPTPSVKEKKVTLVGTSVIHDLDDLNSSDDDVLPESNTSPVNLTKISANSSSNKSTPASSGNPAKTNVKEANPTTNNASLAESTEEADTSSSHESTAKKSVKKNKKREGAPEDDKKQKIKKNNAGTSAIHAPYVFDDMSQSKRNRHKSDRPLRRAIHGDTKHGTDKSTEKNSLTTSGRTNPPVTPDHTESDSKLVKRKSLKSPMKPTQNSVTATSTGSTKWAFAPRKEKDAIVEITDPNITANLNEKTRKILGIGEGVTPMRKDKKQTKQGGRPNDADLVERKSNVLGDFRKSLRLPNNVANSEADIEVSDGTAVKNGLRTSDKDIQIISSSSTARTASDDDKTSKSRDHTPSRARRVSRPDKSLASQHATPQHHPQQLTPRGHQGADSDESDSDELTQTKKHKQYPENTPPPSYIPPPPPPPTSPLLSRKKPSPRKSPKISPRKVVKPLIPHDTDGTESSLATAASTNVLPTISGLPTFTPTKLDYISYGHQMIIKWRPDPTNHNPFQSSYGDPLSKSVIQQQGPGSMYPYLGSASNKKFKGEFNVSLNKSEQTDILSLLGNPRDVLSQVAGGSGGEPRRHVKESLLNNRRSFVLVYDTIPLNSERKILPLSCDQASFVEDFAINPGGPCFPPLSAVLVLQNTT